MNIAALEDEILIRFVVQKRVEALGELYDRYNRLVFSLAFQMVGDQETAEEITQDTFTRLWYQAESYHPQKARVKTWLASIARYRTIDELRRRQAHPTPILLDQVFQASEENLEETVDGRAESIRVRAALNELPPEQREVLVLSYFWGYSQSEISAYLSLPLGTVKTRIRLGMQKMRQNLSDRLFVEQSKIEMNT